jgi:phosphatidylglycerol lysyltransferase
VIGRAQRVPFTTVLVLVLLVVAIITGPVAGPSSFLRHVVGLRVDVLAQRNWWSFITASFFVENLGQLVVVLLAAALGVGASERLMGTRRTIIAFLLTGVLGSAIGLGIQALGVLAGEYWADSVRAVVTLDPLTPIIGTVAVASAFASALWRRRIRTVAVAFTVVFLLYSGQPSDLHRLLAVLLGLAIGALWARDHTRPATWKSSHHETRVLLATVTVIFAVGPIITLLAHARFGLLSPLGMFVADSLPKSRLGVGCTVAGAGNECLQQLSQLGGGGISALALALVPLAVILVGARGLANGRRAAVYLVAGLAAADGLLAAFYFGVVPSIGQATREISHPGHTVEFGAWMVANAALPLLLAVVLVSQRRHFPIVAPRGARVRFLAATGSALLGISALYVGIGSLLSSQFRPAVGFFDLLNDLPERFIPVSFLDAELRDFVPVTMATRLLYHGIGPLFWLIFLMAVIGLLRRDIAKPGAAGEAAEVRNMLRSGAGSLSFPITWPGNSYWFDSERRLVIAYRVANGCAVTTGEPVGDPRDRRDSLGQFITFCDASALTPVFYGIHGEWSNLLVELGWSTSVIAEETVIDPSAWEMSGKRWQDVRTSVNRAAREGVRVTWSSWSSLPVRVRLAIDEISEQWVVEKKLPELGFTLGGTDELRDPDVLIGVAIDPAGVVQAVTSWLPSWRGGVIVGYTLDFMRRRADGMNGVMEFLIAESAVRAKLDGLEFLSLSAAPLARAHSDDGALVHPEKNDGDAVLQRVLGMFRRALEPVYGFTSLFTFKKKFQPALISLRLAYPDGLSLPAIGVAILRCYLPGLSLRESARWVRGLR